ncbi:ARM repeat-containing protein [Serendipita vermifera]|nr:ARM repeat-containing protein [Serendipita vermifera]
MSTQQQAPKPSLTGVRIKARKGAVKAQAKHEPNVFRDQLYKHLETVTPGDFDSYATKLIAAGSQLELLKYSDALFETLLAGGLLQPGGTYLEDGAPRSPFTVLNAGEPVEIGEIKKYAEVFNKLLRRYKYLQKPLEDQSLPGLLQYAHRWPQAQREKFSIMLGLLLAQGLASASCLQILTKDHLVKDYLSISIVTLIFRAYLTDQPIDHLSATLKRGGVKEMLDFFPVNKRTPTELEAWFKKENLTEVSEWYKKKRMVRVRESIITGLKDLAEKEEGTDAMVSFLKEVQSESSVAEVDMVGFIWTGLMSTIDWGNRADQIEGLALKEVGKYAEVLEPFCNGPKTEVALINTAQLYCYEESKVMKTFPQILKVLYNKDCISDQAILYWHSKGSKPQGRQHFLSVTQPLVNFLKEQEDDSDEDDE